MTSLSETSIISGSSGQSTGYNIDQSIRFDVADSAYMYRDFGSAGNLKTWTYSVWFKLGNQALSQSYSKFFGVDHATNDANRFSIMISNDGSESYNYNIEIEGHSTTYLVTDREFRDSSAWYHMVVVVDTTNSVASERVRLYINGQRETSFSTYNMPSEDADLGMGIAQRHYIGAGKNISSGAIIYYFDGYMAETHYVNGYAYGPEYFGEFKENTTIWIPKEYTGSYGTNGFFIDGRDSGDLGDDESGTSTDFTTSGLAAHDFMLDTPTNNFAVMNPLLTKDSDFEYFQGNLKIDFNSNTAWTNGMGASMSMSSGKWYWEAYWTTGTHYTIFGILPTDLLHTCADSGSTALYTLGNFFQAKSGGSTYDFYKQVSTDTTPSGDFAQGDYLQFALDMDNKKFWFGKNNSWFSSGNPAGGSNEMIGSTDLPSDGYTPVFLGYSSGGDSVVQVNFGQDSTFAGVVSAGGNSDGNGKGNFKYSVPSGFLALCSSNLGK